LIYEIKKSSTRPYIEKIWGWDEAVQFNFHRNGIRPEEIKIIQNACGLSFLIVSLWHLAFVSMIFNSSVFVLAAPAVMVRVLADFEAVQLPVFCLNHRLFQIYL
jgi:hypothetical protein